MKKIDNSKREQHRKTLLLILAAKLKEYHDALLQNLLDEVEDGNIKPKEKK